MWSNRNYISESKARELSPEKIVDEMEESLRTLLFLSERSPREGEPDTDKPLVHKQFCNIRNEILRRLKSS